MIVERLDRARYEPVVVLPEPGALVADLEAAGAEVLVRELGVLRRGLMSASGLARIVSSTARDAIVLGKLIRRRRIALVHSNTSVVLGGAAAAAAARVPHIWHVREIYTGFERVWPAYSRVLASAAALPCVSAATAAQFSAAAPIRLIADGLAQEVRRAPRAQARAALKLADDVPVIAALGRISAWKGQDVLVRALAEPPLCERGAIAVIAGQAWPGSEAPLAALRRLVAQVGVADRVRLVGFRDDLETIYGAADLIAVPSKAPDPLPGAAIEAAAAGCTVIASNHGGLPEIVRDGITGRLFAAGDAAALAHLASELLDDPIEAKRLATAAALDVRQRFAPERLETAIRELYDELANQR